jgi:hypothetical protein
MTSSYSSSSFVDAKIVTPVPTQEHACVEFFSRWDERNYKQLAMELWSTWDQRFRQLNAFFDLQEEKETQIRLAKNAVQLFDWWQVDFASYTSVRHVKEMLEFLKGAFQGWDVFTQASMMARCMIHTLVIRREWQFVSGMGPLMYRWDREVHQCTIEAMEAKQEEKTVKGSSKKRKTPSSSFSDKKETVLVRLLGPNRSESSMASSDNTDSRDVSSSREKKAKGLKDALDRIAIHAFLSDILEAVEKKSNGNKMKREAEEESSATEKGKDESSLPTTGSKEAALEVQEELESDN